MPSGKKAPWHWKSWKRDKKGTVKLKCPPKVRLFKRSSFMAATLFLCSVGLKSGHALAKFAQRVGILSEKLHAIRFLREYEEVSHCIVFACTK